MSKQSPRPAPQCYDIEVLSNFFSATFVDIGDTSKRYVFVISPWRNDFNALIAHLKSIETGLVGFNNIGYDYPVIHPFLEQPDKYKDMTGAELVKKIVKRSNIVIDEEWKRDFIKFLVPQRDLFRIHHFNNKGRFTSLKYLQINMDWHDVREMPIHYQSKVKPGAEEQLILDYNLNDVLSTIEFYKKSKGKIKMRKTLGTKYGKDFSNMPDTRMGEAIFLHTMGQITGKSEAELTARKTPRKTIVLKDAIPSKLSFATTQFNEVLDWYKNMTITNTRSKESFSVYFDGMKYDFGLGGIHGLREAGLYKDLWSSDVSGYYPSLSISKRIYPHHLGEAFCDAHAVIKEERSHYKKGTEDSDGLKLAGNGVFGMTNAEWSPFYDPLCAMKTTIGGQLLLAQLCEMITVGNAARVIVCNTDGIEVQIKNEKSFKKYCEMWEKTHGLSLDHSKYKTLAIRDCNNYIGIKEDGKVKEKGDYVTEPEIHKDHSMRIVSKAVKEFFEKGVPVEKTINECQDIKYFVMGKRARSGKLEYREAKSLTELIKEPLPKNVRYYVSRTGGSICKVLKATESKKKNVVGHNQMDLFNVDQYQVSTEEKTRIVGIHKGYRVTLFNKWQDKPFDQYSVDKSFYIQQAKKLIDPILTTQTQIK